MVLVFLPFLELQEFRAALPDLVDQASLLRPYSPLYPEDLRVQVFLIHPMFQAVRKVLVFLLVLLIQGNQDFL